jgi:hypothetical protein
MQDGVLRLHGVEEGSGRLVGKGCVQRHTYD